MVLRIACNRVHRGVCSLSLPISSGLTCAERNLLTLDGETPMDKILIRILHRPSYHHGIVSHFNGVTEALDNCTDCCRSWPVKTDYMSEVLAEKVLSACINIAYLHVDSVHENCFDCLFSILLIVSKSAWIVRIVPAAALCINESF